jgi:hypothetical protein
MAVASVLFKGVRRATFEVQMEKSCTAFSGA